MDGYQLQRIVNQLKDLKPFFRGVFSSDTLPECVQKFPSAYICNTDPAGTEGSHWVAYWFKNMVECEFYDSFGGRPEDYSPWMKNFVDENSFICVYNNIQLQRNYTLTCGFHVLFYMYCRCKGICMKDIVKILLNENSADEYVLTYFEKMNIV